MSAEYDLFLGGLHQKNSDHEISLKVEQRRMEAIRERIEEGGIRADKVATEGGERVGQSALASHVHRESAAGEPRCMQHGLHDTCVHNRRRRRRVERATWRVELIVGRGNGRVDMIRPASSWRVIRNVPPQVGSADRRQQIVG